MMTFNVRLDTADDGDDAWPNRRDLVADTIRYHAPDVVGLQEPFAHQRTSSPRRCPATNGSASPDWRPTARANTRLSATELTGSPSTKRRRSGSRETPEEPGSRGWDGNHPRVATLAHPGRRDDGPTARPREHAPRQQGRSGETRRCGAGRGTRTGARRRHDAGRDGRPELPRRRPPHARLDGLDLGDGRRLEPAAETATFRHGPATTRTDFHELDPGRKIDHVFVPTDCSVTGYAALTDRDETRYPSDHLPVVADVVRR